MFGAQRNWVKIWSELTGDRERLAELETTSPRRAMRRVTILWYVSDFGQHKIVANRFSRGRTALVLDLEYWSLHYLLPFQTKELARTGTAEKRQLTTTLSLCSKNQKASGTVADLLVA